MNDRMSRGGHGWMCVALLVLGGCQLLTPPSGEGAAKQDAASIVRNPAELRLQLARLLTVNRSDIVGTTGDVVISTKDMVVQDAALRYRLRAASDIDRLLFQPLPEEQFLQTWIMAARERLNVRMESGAPRFGDQQEKMDALAKRMEDRIIALGREFYPETVLKEAADDVEREARQGLGATADAMEKASARRKADRPSDLKRIAQLPLAPLTGLQGVADTPQEIAKFTEVARTMTEVLSRLPERSRWETELLLAQAQDLPAITKTLQEVNESRQALERAVIKAEELPESVRRELVQVLEEIRRRQPELLEAIDKANGALEAARAMLAQAEKAAGAVGGATTEVSQLVAKVDSLAKETKAAGDSWAEVIRLVKGPEDEAAGGSAAVGSAADGPVGAAKASDDEVDRIEQIGKVVADARGAAVELRGLLADVEKLSAKESPVEGIRHDAERVMNAAFWRGVGLIVVAFVFGVIWLFVRRVLAPARVV